MRVIAINDTDPSIEIWPGRRVLVRGDLIKLPTGYMSLMTGARNSTVSFGTTTKVTATVSGRTLLVTKLFDAIVEMERPSEGARTIQ